MLKVTPDLNISLAEASTHNLSLNINEEIFSRLSNKYPNQNAKYFKHQKKFGKMSNLSSAKKSKNATQDMIDKFKLSAEFEKNNRQKPLSTFASPVYF